MEAAIGHNLMTRYYLLLLITEFQLSRKGHHRKDTSELWLHQTWNHLNSTQYISNDRQISSWYYTLTLQKSQSTALCYILPDLGALLDHTLNTAYSPIHHGFGADRWLLEIRVTGLRSIDARLKMACQLALQPIDGTLADWGQLALTNVGWCQMSRLGNWLHSYLGTAVAQVVQISH